MLHGCWGGNLQLKWERAGKSLPFYLYDEKLQSQGPRLVNTPASHEHSANTTPEQRRETLAELLSLLIKNNNKLSTIFTTHKTSIKKTLKTNKQNNPSCLGNLNTHPEHYGRTIKTFRTNTRRLQMVPVFCGIQETSVFEEELHMGGFLGYNKIVKHCQESLWYRFTSAVYLLTHTQCSFTRYSSDQ